MGESNLKVQTSHYKMIKCPRDVMYNMLTIVNTTVLFIGKLRVDLKSYKKKNVLLCMVMVVKKISSSMN